MSSMRGFGFIFNGYCRYWYIDAEGTKRWVDNDHPVFADTLEARPEGA